ncbi:penicillin acylase family protein [Croceimicrobium hydrocarbonivorans]|uniref:Penicillin acylase family protein n=1 Tax=Croceimicrobium hydrocarbonivorans TaxID=2761580 RepID=A0A7H0VCJ4_9FLAO|nr:penicillin acylase family protein [Croceimicrobium hydrocarbonivorans]QNR23442.1 penicillin acylase family protein [Croceimicrobium hydrocarbonivorans]
MRNWIWLIVAGLWIALLSIPWPGLPKLLEFFIYPTSVLQVSLEDEDRNFSGSEYPGLRISYDERGVPHLFADSEAELAYGMGFTHAKDRQFQLEMLRRTVKGRLCEVAGWRAVKSDRFWLKFDFDQKSKEAFEKLKNEDPELASVFEAYAKGFNFYLQQQKSGERPPEFHLLGFEPTPMEPHDPIILIRYMDKVLNYSENDLKFSALQKYLPQNLIEYYYPWKRDYIFPIYPEISQVDTINPRQGLRTYIPESDFDSAQVRRAADNEVGSNNWSVAASKSSTGNAFLCNDTHLSLDLPGTWYEVHQVVAGKVAHGFSIPGAPFIISGFTNKVAWGMTNATWDLTEFYKLELNDDRQYKLDGQWEDLIPRTVEFPVKDRENASFVYYDTYFGPLDSVEGDFLATQWVAQNFESSELRAFLDVRRSNNMEEAYQALQNFGHPPQNFVLADNQGNIGMVTSGFALMHDQPRRGIVNANRSNDKARFKHMGRKLYVLNPEKGWNHSANQHQVVGEISPYLNTLFSPSARGRRISEMLMEKPKIDRDHLKKMHGDIIDGEWPLLKDIMINSSPEIFLPYLENWAGNCDEESEAATIYSVFKTAILDTINSQLLGDFDFPPPADRMLYLLYQNKPIPIGSGQNLSRDELVDAAWAGTVKYLGDYYGYNPKLWQYGKYHKIYFRHLLRLMPFNHTPFPAKGSPRTVNVSSHLPGTHGPSMRTLVELTSSNPIAETVLAGGQSGIPGHQHYTDQISDWYNIHYHKINWIESPEQSPWSVTYKFD